MSKISIIRQPEKANKTSFKKGHKGYWLGKKVPKKFIRIEEKSGMWKGDKVGLAALHTWVSRRLKKPTKCEHCGKDGLNGHKIHWANKSQKYKRDLEDWIRLCVRCHILYDKVWLVNKTRDKKGRFAKK